MAAILALTELVEISTGVPDHFVLFSLLLDVAVAGTMFELVKALHNGAASEVPADQFSLSCSETM